MTFEGAPDVLTEAEAAEYLRVSVKTLRNMRWHGKRGPLFVKVGGRVRYSKAEIVSWFESQQRSSTTAAPEGVATAP